jgi:uncharacterized membrane protein
MVEHLVEILVSTFQNLFSKEGTVFFISLLPILELRGGVLAGYFMGLPLMVTSVIAVAGNLLPIPFILLFIEKIFTFMEKHNILKDLVLKLRERAKHKSKGLNNMEFWGLLVFVAIPLPGTGAWTGALVAEVLQMDRKKAFLAITLGVFGALAIMLTVSYGLLNQIGL